MLGYKAIPEEWKSGIPAIADQKFSYTDFTFRTICQSTEKQAIALAERTGGKLDGENLLIKIQQPRAAILEVWDIYGSPVERVAVSDPRWQWKGNWQDDKRMKMSGEKGAEATIEFEGTGAIVVGPYLPKGGVADVYLDGKLHKTIDVYPDENSAKGDESVWHAFRLRNRKHTLRLVVRGEPYGESQGSDIAIHDLVVFR